MARVEIGDGQTNVIVTKDSELRVIDAPYPPMVEQLTHPLRQFFTVDGTPTGDNDLGQDGSVTPIDFCIPASESDDLYVTEISFVVGYGAAGAPYQFGDGAALTNGVRVFYEGKHETVDLHDSITSNQDLFRLSNGNFSTNWEIRGIGAANDYGYFADVHLDKFAPKYGIKLDAGTNQKLIIRVRDTMAAVSTATDTFNAIAHGFYRFK